MSLFDPDQDNIALDNWPIWVVIVCAVLGLMFLFK